MNGNRKPKRLRIISTLGARKRTIGIAHGGQYLLLGWPDYGTLFPIGEPEDFLLGPIFHSGNLRGLAADQGWFPGTNLDPLTRALHVAQAAPAGPYSLQMLGSNSQMGCPVVRRTFIQIPPGRSHANSRTARLAFWGRFGQGCRWPGGAKRQRH